LPKTQASSFLFTVFFCNNLLFIKTFVLDTYFRFLLFQVVMGIQTKSSIPTDCFVDAVQVQATPQATLPLPGEVMFIIQKLSTVVSLQPTFSVVLLALSS
jgi:hypothetical protein